MFAKHTKSISLAVVAGLTSLLVTAAPAFAAAPTSPSAANTGQAAAMTAQNAQPGTSVSSAGAPMGGWLEIAPHSSQWFKFKYTYNDTSSNDTPAQALVKLTMQNPGSVSFDVWTPGRLQNPEYANSDTHHRNPMYAPVGVGSPMFLSKTDHQDTNGSTDITYHTNADVLIWAGGQRATDTFYVQVINNTNSSAAYSLSISGPTVTY